MLTVAYHILDASVRYKDLCPEHFTRYDKTRAARRLQPCLEEISDSPSKFLQQRPGSIYDLYDFRLIQARSFAAASRPNGSKALAIVPDLLGTASGKARVGPSQNITQVPEAVWPPPEQRALSVLPQLLLIFLLAASRAKS